MNLSTIRSCAGALALVAPAMSAQPGAPDGPRDMVILTAAPDDHLTLAAREIKRYIYLRTGALLPIEAAAARGADSIELVIDPALGPQTYSLRTHDRDGARVLTIRAGSGIAALYGAYHLAELLGVRFSLDGDIIPDGRIALELPQIDQTFTPLFAHRGIQPFHDFPEGPDWWSLNDYKTCLSQLVKLRMNWFGLHCYPEGSVGPEPLVWIGPPDEIEPDGSVRAAYPARWASTSGGSWGYGPADPALFAAGASLLFPTADFGSPVTDGHRAMPADDTADVFNHASRLLDEVFTHARSLGIHTVIGTETPLTIPAHVRDRLLARGLDPDSHATRRLLYEGIFQRIAASHPLDTYWLWTPEDWTWGGNTPEQLDATLADIDAALGALDSLGNPFGLATCGWVLGPADDRSLFDRTLPPDAALACISRHVGFAPLETGFARIDGRPEWAIPWLEDDPAMIIPQLWVGRLRRDAADAHAYGCTGLMGIHWRTRILAPNVSALAQAAWDQRAWNPTPGVRAAPPEPPTTDIRLGGQAAAFIDPIAGTDEAPIYQTVRWDVRGYRLRVPDGVHTVTLKFCEPHYREAGKRVFGVALQGEHVIDSLDVFARVGHDAPFDLTFEGVIVEDGQLAIDFAREVEFPCIAGIVIESPGFTRRINCAGPAWGLYEADLPEPGDVVPGRDLPRGLPSLDFYLDWCRAWFGGSAAEPLAALFSRLDSGGVLEPGVSSRSANLPRPADWIAGPGGIVPNRRPWSEVERDYAFVDEMASLRPLVSGPGNLQRFDYWLGAMRYLRAVGRIGCTRGELDRKVERFAGEPDSLMRRTLALDAYTTRVRLAREWEQLITLQLAITETIGEIGTVANLEQHVRRNPAEGGRYRFLECHDRALSEALGAALPAEVDPTLGYLGEPRLFVRAPRPSVTDGESLTVEAVVLGRAPPTAVTLCWRPMGRGPLREIDMRRVGGGIYRATLPPASGEAMELFVRAETAAGRLLWPAAAPDLPHTVVVAPETGA